MKTISAAHAFEEKLTHSNRMFPVSEFIDNFDLFADGNFPSHWHSEVEIQIILRGQAEYLVNGVSYEVGEGCAIYIASEAIHRMRALCAHTFGYNVVLQPQFLTHLLQTIDCGKYAAPLVSRQPEALVITPGRKEGSAALELLRRMYHTESTHAAYELFQLENLLGIYRNLFVMFSKMPSSAAGGGDQREARMRTMLQYIRENYAQPIAISEIAASANISKSECFRCFSELSSTTPIEYVNQFRLLQAAQLLLATDRSVSDICYATGFNNTSYFTRKFREQYSVTPKAYRAQREGNSRKSPQRTPI